MKISRIRQLAEHKTGKTIDKWSWYFAGYERYFESMMDQPINLLEIGVRNGGSLELWAEYFNKAVNIVGCDIDEACAALSFDDERISVVIGDAATQETKERVAKITPEFDLIVDDGSHTSEDIVASFLHYFPLLSSGGVYVAEDLHCSYWPSFGGGVLSNESAMAFFKVLLDLIHRDYWPQDYENDVLRSFEPDIRISVARLAPLLASIESIEFRDSMCFIQRGENCGIERGHRIVSGSQAQIRQPSMALEGSTIEVPHADRERVESLGLSQAKYDAALVAQQLLHEQEIARHHYTHGQEVSILREQVKNLQYAVRDLHQSLSWRLTASLRLVFGVFLWIFRLPRYASTLLGLGEGLAGTIKLAVTVLLDEGLVGIRWRLTNARRIANLESGPVIVGGEMAYQNQIDLGYQEWIRRYDTLTDAKRKSLLRAVDSFSSQPLISFIMPVFDPTLEHLALALNSVQAQLYQNWELCIADDASNDQQVRQLIRRYALTDDRVKYVFREENGHISQASNSALTLATGDYVALLDQDDTIPEHALVYVVEAINRRPDASIVYSDEDKIDEAGVRFSPSFKPDFNWELFLGQNLVSHLGIYSRLLVEQVGGFREGVEGSQDWDLALRVLELSSPEQIVHIPRVLYHWRATPGSAAYSSNAKPYALGAGVRAVKEYLARSGISAEVDGCALSPVFHRVRFALPTPLPKISIIIPTRDQQALLAKCVGSIKALSSYKNYEIIVIDNGSTCADTLAYLSDLERQGMKILQDPTPFNYSKLSNQAVAQAAGSVICLLNNDIEVITPDWLEEMVSHVSRSDVGCVGAKLSYPDRSLQHGGVIIGLSGVAGHLHKYLPHGHAGYLGRAALLQELSAVTGACLMVRRDVYELAGGLNEELAVAFNDIDFCLRVRELGFRNLWTPFAECYHHESISRGADTSAAKAARYQSERGYMKNVWGDTLSYDPAYNPNLTIDAERLALAEPPRVTDL